MPAMTAFRTSLMTVLWFVFAAVSAGQGNPLRNPVQGIETGLEYRLEDGNRVADPYPSDAGWLDVQPIEEPVVIETRPVEIGAEPIGAESIGAESIGAESIEAGAGEGHLHPWPQPLELESADSGEACACGKKHCPGVCRDPGHPEKPKWKKPGDRDRGDCPPLRYRIPDCQRAGNPHCVARWAKCSVTDKYSAWFTGGGAAFCRGRCRKPTEGTWGLDYSGFFGHANVWLKYTRGRMQGGEGAYRTDGEPKIVSRAHELIGLGH